MKGGIVMDKYTYTELFNAADLLWPGQATEILDNLTEDQERMILAVLDSAKLSLWQGGKNSVCFSGASVI